MKALLNASTAKVVEVWGADDESWVFTVEASVAKKVGGEW